PTHPPIPLPGIWIPGPPLPSGTTAGDVVVMPFVQSGVGGQQLIGFAIANTKTNGTVDDTALGFRFATQQFETLPILGTLAPFFGAATAIIPAPFGATAAVGGIDAGDGSTVLATARLMNAFAGDGPAGVSVQQAALPGVTA